jgi:hypothetical protein
MAKDNTQYKIFEELDEIETNYYGKKLEKIDGLQRSQYEVIKMCEYYSDSKYLEANKGNRLGGDGRPVPFQNIVNYRVALAKTATDLDIKDIQIVSDNPDHQVHSMLLNREAYEWMKESGFSGTLNKMGLTRPKYGGYLLKKTEEDKELKIDIVPWTKVMTDQMDILGGTIVEKHHMTPVSLMKKKDVWDNVKEVLQQYKKVEAADRDMDITVYEVTGELSNTVYNSANGLENSDEDEYTFSLQHYFVAELDEQKFLLFSEKLSGEMGDYYEYLAWEDNGYGLGRGVIEDSEEAQVWTNDAVINESIAMALAGRVGIKTNSKKIGNNILDHDHGKIYELEDNKEMSAFNLAPSALGQYQNIIDRWNQQADNVTSSYDAATGEQPPSGTPYSQTALLNAVATKPFDYKREEWGIHLTKIFEGWVIPYLTKKIRREHILVSEFSDQELEMIDESFAVNNANQELVEDTIKALSGQGADPTADSYELKVDKWKERVRKSGKKRFIEVPEDYFKGVVPKVTVLVTGEQLNKAVILTSISQLMGTVIQSFNPQTGTFGVLEDPTLSKLFNQALELSQSGISPVSLGKGQRAPLAQAPAAVPPPVPEENPVAEQVTT